MLSFLKSFPTATTSNRHLHYIFKFLKPPDSHDLFDIFRSSQILRKKISTYSPDLNAPFEFQSPFIMRQLPPPWHPSDDIRKPTSKSGYAPQPTHGSIEPYQIFHHQQRHHIAEQNPERTPLQITSLISQMWRALSADQRQEYFSIAIEFVNQQPPPPPTRRRRAAHAAPDPGILHPNDDGFLVLDPLPEFAIVPRRSSGTAAARVSEEFTFAGRATRVGRSTLSLIV
jgi:hypothetical protein